MSTEMTPLMIEEYYQENARFGKNAVGARTGIRLGGRSFRLTPDEITLFDNSPSDWIHSAFLTSRVTGIPPKEIHFIYIGDEIVTVIPLKI